MQTQIDPTLIENIQDFYRSWCDDQIAQFAQRYPRDQRVLELDFSKVRQSLPEVADDYLEQPEAIRDHFEIALEEYDLPAPVDLSGATVRFAKLNDSLDDYTRIIGEWTPTEIANSFAVLRGQVAKRSQKQILVTKAVFECQRCGNTSTIPQIESPTLESGTNGLQEPHECTSCERQGPFKLDDKATADHGKNFQTIRLQRPPGSERNSRETLDVNVKSDLVDTVRPGDRVAVGTEVKGRISDGGNAPTMELYGEADAIDRLESDFTDIDTAEYIDEIETIADSDDPYQEIIDSILPSHRGHETLKEAIAYQLFGGVNKTAADGNEIRGTIHIFAVGDPGVGKSTLLRYVEKLAPRSVYTTGTGSTAAGLTCAAMKDDFGDGGWTLEAGALVEAHNGVCCIDELDDMAEEDRAGLNDAMSEQRINVSKAGINAELPANTRVLAAANPDLGRFDEYEPVAEQIDVHPALLSRFDLIFTMTDEPDEEDDLETAAHINKSTKAAQRRESGQTATDADREIQPPIGPELMRAYIAHAQQYTPVMTDAADRKIQSAYAGMRQANGEDSDAIPTTPRMVGALTRLSEAAARIRLSEEITAEDVQRAVEIYESSMEDVGMDPETDDFDADVVETGTGQSQRSRVQRLKREIRSIGEDYDSGAPIDVVLDIMEQEGFDRDRTKKEIDNLLEKGQLYRPRNGNVQTTD